MKIVIGGPPHSGKTVFIANLTDRLPTDAYTIIRACPDGEGTWSNNKNQKETSNVRKKGKFTKTFVDGKCKSIDNQDNEIVIVDVGGIISKENKQIFKHCDSFIVLSSDEKKKKQWIKFGESLGLNCIAVIDSTRDGKEEIYSREPFLQGRISGLEKGKTLEDSAIIKALVSDIVEKSDYRKKEPVKKEKFDGILIDDTELGFELGYGKERFTEDDTPIKKVRWKEKAVPQVYEATKKKISKNQPVKINGIRANFILSAICKVCKEKEVTDVSAYDIGFKRYMPIKNLPKKRGLRKSEGLSYNIIENKENIFMDVDITKEQYSLEDYEKCILPKINEGKNLYISGRMPLWLLASMSTSYDSKRIFTFQPGNGFTCVSSVDEKDLGMIVDGAEGIDINRYFEDKKNVDSNLLILPQKQSIFSKIKNLFKGINSKKMSKYLDPSIKMRELTDTYEIKEDEFSKVDVQQLRGLQKSSPSNIDNEQLPEEGIPDIDIED